MGYQPALSNGAYLSRANLGYWQGRRARYRGLRENLFDLRRGSVVMNMHVLSHYSVFTAAGSIIRRKPEIPGEQLAKLDCFCWTCV